MTTRRSYAGGAAVATITADLGPAVLAVPISTTVGWPTGSVGPFSVVINQGFSDEEKALCSGLSGSTLTFQTRGYDGTTAQSHTGGSATIAPCITAVDLSEANFHTSSNTGVHGITGGVVGTSDPQTLSGKTFSDSPTITDFTNLPHTHTSAVQGGVLGGFFNSPEWSTVTTGGSSDPNALTIPHGAPFTPSRALVGYANLNTSFTSWTGYHLSATDATNVYITFFSGTTPVIPSTITVRLIVFP